MESAGKEAGSSVVRSCPSSRPSSWGCASAGLVRRSGRGGLDLTETAVREWVRQAERDAGTGANGA